MDKETVCRLAQLSRITLTEEETEQMVSELGALAGLAEELEPLTQNKELPERILSLADLRDDTVLPGIDRSVLLSAAPKQRDGFFTVPRAVEAVKTEKSADGVRTQEEEE